MPLASMNSVWKSKTSWEWRYSPRAWLKQEPFLSYRRLLNYKAPTIEGRLSSSEHY